MRHLGVDATARASFGLYNDESDIDALCAAVEHAASLFS
jgi:cysteine desulfurase/selenocysteine lyase